MTVDASGKGFTLPSGPTSLSFDKEEFMKKDFEVDKFIVDCRKKVPLETLRDDLDLYLKVIRSAMIELINKDYADFVNLSTNLVGMDKAIGHLTTPLGQLKEEVLSVQTAMDGAIKAVHEKIKHQQEIQRKKAVLQRLMNIQHSVEKIEKLLDIQQGAENAESPGQLTGPLIERVATEFNKLQFYVSRSKGHPLVDKVKPRIAAITTTLQYSLEGSFLSGLETGNVGMLRQCLRTYALIDKTHDAEELFREHVVRPYMEEVILEECVSGDIDKMNKMMDKILAFIPDKCSLLMTITSGTSGGEVVRGYNFLVNAVFPEIVSGLETRSTFMFAPGNPDVFYKKYLACMQFLEQFEAACSSQASVKCLRSHASYLSLMNKWSLPVYFQIRFQDIGGSLENAIFSGLNPSNGPSDFHLCATSALWSALSMCWDEGIFLPALTHRFLKLNLQLLSRYNHWLNEMYQREAAKKADTGEKKARSSTPDKISNPAVDGFERRSVSPQPTQQSVGNVTTGQIVLLLSDMDKLAVKVPELFDTRVKPRLKSLEMKDTSPIADLMSSAVGEISSCGPRFWSLVTEELVKACGSHLSQVNDIPRLYRRTNKEMPSKPSMYLAAVIRPLTQFCDEHANTLSEVQRKEFLAQVFSALTQQFSDVTCEVLTSTKKMEESLRRLKKARGGDKDKEKSTPGTTDSDKIRSQLILDITNFQKQMTSLGLQPDTVDGMSRLAALAQEAKSDMSST